MIQPERSLIFVLLPASLVDFKRLWIVMPITREFAKGIGSNVCCQCSVGLQRSHAQGVNLKHSFAWKPVDKACVLVTWTILLVDFAVDAYSK